MPDPVSRMLIRQSIRMNKDAYTRTLDAMVMMQAQTEKHISLVFDDFRYLPPEVRGMLEEISYRMNALRSSYREMMGIQFDRYIDALEEDDKTAG